MPGESGRILVSLLSFMLTEFGLPFPIQLSKYLYEV